MPRAARSGTRADALLLAVSAVVAVLAAVLPDDVRAPVAAAFRRTVMSPLATVQAWAELSRSEIVTHRARAAQADSVAMRALQADALRADNDHLRRMLGLAGRTQWGFVPAEALHGRRGSPEYSVTLTVGARAGVKAFSPVIAPEGLVGMIATVDPDISLAILTSHPDFRVSAMTVDGLAYGIVQPHLGSGADRYLLELTGVPSRLRLAGGAVIVSSGLGGTYPRGVPVGTVERELSSQGYVRTYLVRPAVIPSDVSSVMVLGPERAATGVTGVWATAAAADSAARAMAAAGDSVARRDSAAAQASRAAASPARAQMPDTTARDSTPRAPVAAPSAGTPPAGAPALARPPAPRPPRQRPVRPAPRADSTPPTSPPPALPPRVPR